MTFIEAAAEVLRKAGKPLHYKEITELAIANNLLSHVGKTPEVTMSHRLTSAIKKDDNEIPIVKVKPGVFALREWSTRKGAATASREEAESPATEQSPDADAPASADVDVNALEIEAALRGPEAHVDSSDDDEAPADEDRATPVSGDEALRADLAASGAELFGDEEDDDQPILAPPPQPGDKQQVGLGEASGGRRRRRRRRRGRGGSTGEPALTSPAGGPVVGGAEPRLVALRSVDSANTTGEASTATALASNDDDTPSDGRDPSIARPVVRDRQQIMATGQPTGIDMPIGEADELVGRELADAVSIVLTSIDRGAGPVPARSIAETLARRGRLPGDLGLAAAQVNASLRADNLRRSAAGQRVRFRFASGGRIGLTDWILGGELPRLEQEVHAVIERYRESSRRAMLRRLQELPGHALIELVLIALERVGMTGLKAIRRPGSPGGEAHFSAIHKTEGDAIPTAIIVRKDGRELGRERVCDLRGALHHYGPATVGWLMTTGQVLSGAREEAAAIGTATVTLYDGIALCRLLEDLDVGMVKSRFSIAIPDLELLEALRG
jgi:hypothetical protein